MTYKKLTRQAPFQLDYGKEVVMPMEYIVPSLRIVAIMEMTDVGDAEERLSHLGELEEERFVARYHKNIEKK